MNQLTLPIDVFSHFEAGVPETEAVIHSAHTAIPLEAERVVSVC